MIVNLERVQVSAREELTKAEQSLPAIREMRIESKEDQEFAAEILREVKATARAIEDKRKTIVDPLNKALKATNDLFRPISDALKAAERELKQKIADYLIAGEARNQALLQTAASAETSEEAMRALAKHEPVEAPTGVSMRFTWTFEVVDEARVPREYLCVDEAKVKQLIKNADGRLPKVAGIRFQKVPIVASRR